MLDNRVFVSARALSEITYKYVDTVARELGVERALALLGEVMEPLARHQAQVIRESVPSGCHDVGAAFSLSRTIIGLAFGMELTPVEKQPDRVLARSGRCPVYEACQLWGVESRGICRAGPTRFIDRTLKLLNPELSYQIVKYRASAEDFCQSAVVLGQPYAFPG